MSPIRMNLMTGRAGNLVLHVAAFEAPNLRRLVQMTGEADLIGGRSGELARITNIRRRCRRDVFLPRTMARFAGTSFEPASFLGFDGVMRALLKGVVYVAVAGLAHFRTDIAGRKCGLRRLSRRAQGRQEQSGRAPAEINTAHGPCRRQTRHRRCDKLGRLRRATWYWKACEKQPECLRDIRCTPRKSAD